MTLPIANKKNIIFRWGVFCIIFCTLNSTNLRETLESNFFEYGRVSLRLRTVADVPEWLGFKDSNIFFRG